jgi:hypothetical protein
VFTESSDYVESKTEAAGFRLTGTPGAELVTINATRTCAVSNGNFKLIDCYGNWTLITR